MRESLALITKTSYFNIMVLVGNILIYNIINIGHYYMIFICIE